MSFGRGERFVFLELLVGSVLTSIGYLQAIKLPCAGVILFVLSLGMEFGHILGLGILKLIYTNKTSSKSQNVCTTNQKPY